MKRNMFLALLVPGLLAALASSAQAQMPPAIPNDFQVPLRVYFQPSIFPLELRSGSLAVADFDADGTLDAAVTGTYVAGVAIVFAGSPVTLWFDAGRWPVALAAADLDGDGDMDLAVANRDGGGVSILTNPGDGHMVRTAMHPTGLGPHAVVAADISGDGKPDLVVANRWAGSVSVLANTGTGFSPAQTIEAAGEPNALALADLDKDGDLDIAVACAADDAVRILLNSGDSFSLAGAFEAGPYPVAVAAADLDNDGDVDLAVTNREAFQVTLLLNDGSAGFGQTQTVPLTDDPQFVLRHPAVDVLLADFNYDGLTDIYCEGRLLRNRGNLDFVSLSTRQNVARVVYAVARLEPYLYPILATAFLSTSWGTLYWPSVSSTYQRGADTNADGTVDVLDLIAVLVGFGASRGMVGYDPYADLNANGIVDVFDVIEVVTHFGTTYQP